MRTGTSTHIGTGTADIKAKEAERLRLQEDLEAFMANGGKVQVFGQEKRPLLHPSMRQLNDSTWDKLKSNNKPRNPKC